MTSSGERLYSGGSKTNSLVPSCHALLSSSAKGGRKTYRHRRSTPARSCADTHTLACSEEKNDSGFEEHFKVPQARSVKHQQKQFGGPKGLRSPVHSRSACRWPGGWS